MNTVFLRSGPWVLGFSLVALGPLAGCITDDSGSGGDSGGSAGSSGGSAGSGGTTAGTGGSGGSGGTTAGSGGTAGTTTSGTVCAAPIVLSSSKPAIADFEGYDGSADLATWSFALGGDSSTGVFAGTFGYGDDAGGFPETFAMIDGNGSTYALDVADTLSEEYGGGMGLWLSDCLDASAFTGIAFWVRGSSPTGDAKLSILMKETTSSAATMVGTCPGTDDTCIHPSFTFPVTDTWTEFRVSWSGFTPGDAAGTRVVPDGRNVWQIQYDIGLSWVPDTGGGYQPTPSAYELTIDDLTFY